jgi:hypothetical protein
VCSSDLLLLFFFGDKAQAVIRFIKVPPPPETAAYVNSVVPAPAASPVDALLKAVAAGDHLVHYLEQSGNLVAAKQAREALKGLFDTTTVDDLPSSPPTSRAPKR